MKIKRKKPSMYKNVPLEIVAFQKLIRICHVNSRKQGAQLKILIEREYEKLFSETNQEQHNLDSQEIAR